MTMNDKNVHHDEFMHHNEALDRPGIFTAGRLTHYHRRRVRQLDKNHALLKPL
jgi:hypothetical protein